MKTEELTALNAKGRVYTVREVGTQDHYGNHTYSEAAARARIMRRNWQYKKNFEVIEGKGWVMAHVQLCGRVKRKLEHTLIINEGGTEYRYECANGFVSRCVSAVHDLNAADARELAKILNAHFATKKD